MTSLIAAGNWGIESGS